MFLKGTCFKTRILRSLATGGTLWPEAAAFSVAPELADQEGERALKVLLVVAHPDDESECAAVLYRITHELGGTVDQVVVTNGEAGFQHSVPAQAYYKLDLIREDVGRKHLPKIRRREVLRASQILGIRNTHFLNQRDNGFTLDLCEGLHTWDVGLVRSRLVELLERENYDCLFTLLPTEDTHGHHKTVALLALRAAAEFAPEQRPAVLGVRTSTSEDLPHCFHGSSGFLLTPPANGDPTWRFDRRTPMTGHPEREYGIVANWVIAEHKSQGMFQMEFGRKRFECFWLFDIGGLAGCSRWDRFRGLIDRPREYVVHERHKRDYARVGS